MSDEPIKFEERMFNHIKVDEDKPTMPFDDCFQQGMGTELYGSFTLFTYSFCPTPKNIRDRFGLYNSIPN